MPSFSRFLKFLYGQWFIKPTYPKQSCKGKTIIVTGANVGLGYEAAKHFVRLGAEKVILGVRSIEKGEAAKAIIEKEANSSGVVEVWELNLSRYESVKAFATRVDSLERIDAVLENAGVATNTYSRVEEDESTITINVVSTFLLAVLVLPALRRSASRHNITPTITVVSSELHSMTNFPERTAQPSIFAHLSDEATADMKDRYNLSKLLVVFIVRELCQSEIKQPYPVTLNMIAPGFCRSSLGREIGGTWGFKLLEAVLARTTEMGSRTLVHAALAGKETHGEYMENSNVASIASWVRSEEGKKTQERVWGGTKPKA